MIAAYVLGVDNADVDKDVDKADVDNADVDNADVDNTHREKL